MRKRTIMLITILLCALALTWHVIKINMVKSANSIPPCSMGLCNVEDGIYTGKYQLSPVKVILEVEVGDKVIHKINILKHENGLGSKAEEIVDHIIKKQTLDVDIISGATISSKVILKAVDNALRK